MIYLDNASTTKMREEVLKAMMPFLTNEYGNPEAKYYELAVNAKKAIEKSRIILSDFFGCKTSEIIFNSGASEGNNFILKGMSEALSCKGKHIITSQIEHPSVIETCKYLETKGFEVTYLSVNEEGIISIDELQSSIRPDTTLVSVMWVNNETGSIQPIEEIAKICKKNSIFFHSDATQAVGKILLDLNNVNSITFSAHKINGPKGIGAVILKHDKLGIPIKITPLIHGGDQEFGYRAGTHAVPLIVGLGEAIRLIKLEFENSQQKLRVINSKVREILKNRLKDIIEFNNNIDTSSYSIINIRLKDINNQILIKDLSNHIALSNGSACSTSKPSHVLKAMNKDIKEIHESIRLSLSVDFNVEKFKNIIESIF